MTPDEDVARVAAGPWFCDRGDFWGTTKQLCLCAKCGIAESKRHDEPRHYARLFTPQAHMLCDDCFDQLPDDETLSQSTKD